MGAPGTTVEGAEKPVMRAVVRVRREVVEARRARKCITVDGVFLFQRWVDRLICKGVFFYGGSAEMSWMIAGVWWQLSNQEGNESNEAVI
jgi:hypothetical protein